LRKKNTRKQYQHYIAKFSLWFENDSKELLEEVLKSRAIEFMNEQTTVAQAKGAKAALVQLFRSNDFSAECLILPTTAKLSVIREHAQHKKTTLHQSWEPKQLDRIAEILRPHPFWFSMFLFLLNTAGRAQDCYNVDTKEFLFAL
jgi:hypothetical protein